MGIYNILKKCRLFHRIKELEEINNILIDSKPKMIQLYNHNTTKLKLLNNDITDKYIYGTEPSFSTELFKTEVKTDNHNILDIKISSSFIPIIPYLNQGTVLIKLIANGTLLVENETFLTKDGYTHVTINHLQEVEEYSSYDIIVTYECCITVDEKLNKKPKLAVKNDGASLSILIL